MDAPMERLHADVTGLKADVAELRARTEALLDMLRRVANLAKSTASVAAMLAVPGKPDQEADARIEAFMATQGGRTAAEQRQAHRPPRRRRHR